MAGKVYIVALLSITTLLINCKCANLTKPVRIIGGRNARRGAYPYIVSVLAHGNPICGGSLLNKQHVLTARHCVKAYGASSYRVKVGEYDSSRTDPNEQTIGVSKIKFHSSRGVDLAVLELSKDVSMAYNIKAITLASEEPNVGRRATVIGWGWTIGYNPYSASDILQELSIYIQSDRTCQNDGLSPTWPWDHLLCAGRTYGWYANSCYGDSGGPLVAGSELVGVVRAGHPKCPRYKNMAAYESVARSKSWIQRESKEFSRGGGGGGKGCFASNSEVVTASGPLPISKLQIGDSVQAINSEGNVVFSEVIAFLDRQPEVITGFTQVTTDSGIELRLTPLHLTFRRSRPDKLGEQSSEEQYRTSESVSGDKLRPGDILFRVDPRSKKISAENVTSVSQVTMPGAYAPLTEEGTLIVDGIVSSSYAHVRHHSVAHAAFAPLRWFHGAKRTLGKPSKMAAPDEGVNWYAQILMDSAGHFVMTQ